MPDPRIVLAFGDQEFILAGITVQDMAKVKAWTGLPNRRAWLAAIGEEDPGALIAAYTLCQQRAGATADYATADFDLDILDTKLVDETGREIELIVETKDDGSLLVDRNGAPILARDTGGKPMWRYIETGETVPPTEPAAPAT